MADETIDLLSSDDECRIISFAPGKAKAEPRIIPSERPAGSAADALGDDDAAPGGEKRGSSVGDKSGGDGSDDSDDSAGDAELLRPLSAPGAPATQAGGAALARATLAGGGGGPAAVRGTHGGVGASPELWTLAGMVAAPAATIALSEESDSGDDDYFEELSQEEQARRIQKGKEKKRRQLTKLREREREVKMGAFGKAGKAGGKRAGEGRPGGGAKVAKRARVPAAEKAAEKAEKSAASAKKDEASAAAKVKKDEAAAAKIAAKEKRAAEKARKEVEKAEKEAEKVKAHEEEARVRIAQFQKGGTGNVLASRATVAILLPKEMTEKRVGEKLLNRLEEIYPGQVVVRDKAPMMSSVCWRCRDVVSLGSSQAVLGKEKEFAAVCYSAKDFCDLIHRAAVEQFAMHMLNSLPGKRVELVLVGVDNFCKAEMNRVASSGDREQQKMLVYEALVRDTCVTLWMEYNIVTRHVNDEKAKSEYLILLTERIAMAPHRKEESKLEIDKVYRRAGAGGRLAAKDQNGETRLETSSDLGAIYISFLDNIPSVSRVKARAIRMKYPTLGCLLDAYNTCCNARARSSLLSDVVVGTRRLGPVLSERISQVFTSLDAETRIRSAAPQDGAE